MSQLTHTCGWQHGPEDKYCRGCGERLFKSSREYGEIRAEMSEIQKQTTERPNPASAAVGMMIFNVLAWAAGDSQMKPSDMLSEMEKIAGKMPPGFGFPPPGGEPPKE